MITTSNTLQPEDDGMIDYNLPERDENMDGTMDDATGIIARDRLNDGLASLIDGAGDVTKLASSLEAICEEEKEDPRAVAIEAALPMLMKIARAQRRGQADLVPALLASLQKQLEPKYWEYIGPFMSGTFVMQQSAKTRQKVMNIVALPSRRPSEGLASGLKDGTL